MHTCGHTFARIEGGKTGAQRNVLTFMPPLIVEESELDRTTEALDKVLRRIS